MKLALKVIPNAKKSEAAGWEDDPRAGRVLKLRIAAPPVEGKANRARHPVPVRLAGRSPVRRQPAARRVSPAESGGAAGRLRGKACPAAA